MSVPSWHSAKVAIQQGITVQQLGDQNTYSSSTFVGIDPRVDWATCPHTFSG